ncbi:MAG: tRNA (guanosine(46)-N7)-methyltransferase TrmB [Spirochaetaceae bacterium]|nr:tRNA (guanosine(46)-N7)-methyltransferase TrmB [Spirochaetaceae bacterium]
MLQTNNEKPLRVIKSFVIRTGRMTKGQISALKLLSPEYVIPFEEINAESQYIKKISELCFSTRKAGGKVIVEIGFGNGKVTAMIAEKNINNFYIGIEVYKSGIGSLLKLIDEKKINNIRIINHDAVEVTDKLDLISEIDGFHIFFPDPWPKRSHIKRRIINTDFTKKIIDKLKAGGYIYAVTDWKDYGIQMQQVFRSFPSLYSPFENFIPNSHEQQEEKYADIIPWRAETNFERKGLKKNHIIYESFFIKK